MNIKRYAWYAYKRYDLYVCVFGVAGVLFFHFGAGEKDLRELPRINSR